MNFLSKLIFFLKRPKIIVITGKGSSCAAEAIFQVLKEYKRTIKISSNNLSFKIDKNTILIFESDDKKIKEFEYFLRKSSMSILVITHLGDIPYDRNFFNGERNMIKETLNLAKTLPAQTNLILNFDDETTREIDDFTNLQTLTFGFNKNADFWLSDVRLNGGTNFKINYRGNIIPFWLEGLFGKEQVYSALASAAVGIALGLNLVEISQALKNYKSLPGRMQLIEGIKNSKILDDSESATVLSMIEAIETFKRIETKGKKIAVLGDIIGIGKYTIEAHEAIGERVARPAYEIIGEKVARAADFLFTVGARAKFIAKGAYENGMEKERIFKFDELKNAGLVLQDKIKQGDLILIDGSREMNMQEIVEEIKKM